MDAGGRRDVGRGGPRWKRGERNCSVIQCSRLWIQQGSLWPRNEMRTSPWVGTLLICVEAVVVNISQSAFVTMRKQV